ncbi:MULTISPECIES: cytochrome c biogenesis heme-transporting ATPase CcmA [Alcaligenes]|uniref:Cytochrome c biogenesis heme-transporting ATPase CcmA n=1 Tax=Alcaligenes phenolicus TaxID=232846 RepID=A0AAW5VRW9_9BURK|nr:cytochrome c biogenesis heme-transporting ATPase CcmA [Alcaligenes phenolicus]MCR4145770.1 cytochrome c biogenesis heme-transporting ATPase CcmA [Alcaligenes faecalis]MCX5564072.1 cytochrome c biogenesis heme-transporting ATPase CcmA [Alcaligenes phenolicus]
MLQAVSLTCRRGQRRVFSELSLRLEAGQCCLVSGPNGSGKTSLLRILANIAQADKGQLFWHDRPVQSNDSDYRRQLVYGGHAPGLNGSLSVQENLDSLLMQDRVPLEREACDQALLAGGLLAYRRVPVRQLSAGQRRRVFLVRLSLSNRPLWILDEQLTALDSAGQKFLGELIAQHLQKQGSVILTSHQTLPWDLKVQHLDLGQAC